MKFYKMHSLGNDFVIMETPQDDVNLSSLARFLGDRKLGVGCDQIIFFDKNALDVKFFNCDGSEAEMCGNGIRSLGLLYKKLYKMDKIIFNTILSKVEVCIDNDNLIETTINILPTKYSHEYQNEIISYIAKNVPDVIDIKLVNVGNPHVVLFFDSEASINVVLQYGSMIEKFVDGGINVGFAHLIGNILTLKVWERGAGFTSGCGSGACAAAFASLSRLNLQSNVDNNSLIIKQVGGDVVANPTKKYVILKGKATLVFTGDIDYE